MKVRAVPAPPEVELKGAIFDERQRQALKVTVDNVPGVKAVHDHLIWIEPVSGKR